MQKMFIVHICVVRNIYDDIRKNVIFMFHEWNLGTSSFCSICLSVSVSVSACAASYLCVRG